MGLRERLSLRLDLRVIQRKQCASTVTQKGIRSVAAQNSWVLDIRCGTHIFTVLQGLKKSRKLKHGELNLVMGNKKITLVTKIGKYELLLKSGVMINLNNCCYTSEIFSFDNENGDILIPLKYSKESIEPTGKNDKARRGTFFEREMISNEDSGSKIDLEEIQESGDEEPVDKISDITLSELDEPANYKEAMASPKAAKWKEAMKSEIQSMYDNQVWNVVDTIPGLKIVGCKWIFKKKRYMDGNVHTYKARIMLAIAAFHGYEIWQMDVKTAFLNGKLTDDVFVAQPEGLKMQSTLKECASFKRPFMDLNKLLVSRISASLRKSHTLDFLKAKMRNDIPTLQSVKDLLEKCFTMKDLGDAAYVLGIKIYINRSKRLIGLSHDTYFDKILKIFKMENSKKENLPLHHGIKISKDLCPTYDAELDKMSRVPYASAIRSIIYAMTCTRPDVSFTLSMVSRHQQNSDEGHWTALAKDDSRSQSGWVFLLNGGAVIWKSSKKDTVADCTCESEYIAACEASKEAMWMKNFIGDFRVVPTVQDPI
ncbi:putative RNA-directed DNA polymerase [Tanacetum coccineum]